MDHSQTDSTNGRAIGRQVLVLGTNLGIIILSFLVIILIQVFTIYYATGESVNAVREHFRTDWWLVINLMLFLPLWYTVILVKRLGWVNPDGNKVLPSLNTFYHAKVAGGGTKFIIYTGGLALAYLWEKFYPEQDIESEQKHSHEEDGTITINGTGLKVRFQFFWKPMMSNLSHFLQVGTTPSKRKDALDGLLDEIVSMAETIASTMRMSGTGLPLTYKDVKNYQGFIAEAVRRKLQTEIATELGFNIVRVGFTKCDLSESAQESLDVMEIATRIQEDMRLSNGPIDPLAAYQLALLAAGKSGTSVNRFVLDIPAAPELSQAIKSMGPDLVKVLKQMGPAFANLAAAVQRLNANTP